VNRTVLFSTQGWFLAERFHVVRTALLLRPEFQFTAAVVPPVLATRKRFPSAD
jgi:hypothetical protein